MALDIRARIAETLFGGTLTQMREGVSALQEELRQSTFNEEILTERLAELELALEDANWMSLMLNGEQEFSREGLKKICQLARLMFLKNPLIKRSVMVKALYVWAQGLNVKATDTEINQVLQNFWDDPANRTELTSHQARMLKEIDLEVDGNIFFVFFVNPSSGDVKVRTAPTDEIVEIISDPEDSKTPWLYKRVWIEKNLKVTTGRTITTRRTAYYPDWRWEPATRPPKIGSDEIRWDTPIYHVKTGSFSAWKFGCSEVYAAIDWARAYKEFLEDVASLMRAYSRFAWKLTTKGGKKGVAAAKTKLGTTLAAGGSAETNPPSTTGSTFIAGQNADGQGVDIQPMQLRGASISPEDGRRFLLMVAANFGLPETYYGDVSVGTLATGKTLDRPTELMMRERQTFWTDVLANIIGFALMWAVKASDGKLQTKGAMESGKIVWAENVNPHLDIDFPPLLERDVQTAIQAVVTGLTLNGQSLALLNEELATRLVLKAMGEDDIDEIMAELFPDETKSVSQTSTPSEAKVKAAAKKLAEAIIDARKSGELKELIGAVAVAGD